MVDHQLERSLHSTHQFQDVKYPVTTGHPPPQRLDGEDGPERGLLLGMYSFSIPRLPQNKVERQAHQFHLPLIWSVQCTSDFYQSVIAFERGEFA